MIFFAYGEKRCGTQKLVVRQGAPRLRLVAKKNGIYGENVRQRNNISPPISRPDIPGRVRRRSAIGDVFWRKYF